MTTYEATARQRELLADTEGIRMRAALEEARNLDRLEGAVAVLRARLGLLTRAA